MFQDGPFIALRAEKLLQEAEAFFLRLYLCGSQLIKDERYRAVGQERRSQETPCELLLESLRRNEVLVVLRRDEVDREVARDLIKDLISEGLQYLLTLRVFCRVELQEEVEKVICYKKIPRVLLLLDAGKHRRDKNCWVIELS